jgi:hypothetical protein
MLAAADNALPSAADAPIPLNRIDAVFSSTGFRQTNAVIALANIRDPLPWGDLAEYAFYPAAPGHVHPQLPRRPEFATLTAFRTVRRAEAAAGAIDRGGPCVAHARSEDGARVTSPWPGCEHLRVANVVLLISSTAPNQQRRIVVAALRKLGRPRWP